MPKERESSPWEPLKFDHFPERIVDTVEMGPQWLVWTFTYNYKMFESCVDKKDKRKGYRRISSAWFHASCHPLQRPSPRSRHPSPLLLLLPALLPHPPRSPPDSRSLLPHPPRNRPGNRGPRLKGSIGEEPNQTNYSDQSSVRILVKFRNFRQKTQKIGNFQHFPKYRRNSDKISSKSE